MTRHTGGNDVKSGFYWNLAKWELTTIPREGGPLPGGGDDRYLRVPVVAMLLLAPVMGGLYVVFLPFVGFAMVLSYLSRRVAVAAQDGTVKLMGIMSPGWQPGEAYLEGRRKRAAAKQKAKAEASPTDEPLDELRKEIDARRKRQDQ